MISKEIHLMYLVAVDIPLHHYWNCLQLHRNIYSAHRCRQGECGQQLRLQQQQVFSLEKSLMKEMSFNFFKKNTTLRGARSNS